MMRGMYSMDRVMDTEFRGDHSDTDPIDFVPLTFCVRGWLIRSEERA